MGMLLQILGVLFLLVIAYALFRLAILLGKAVIIMYAVKKIIAHAANEHASTSFQGDSTGPEAFSPDRISPVSALAGVMTGRFDEDQVRQIRESMTLKMYRAVAKELSQAYRDQCGKSGGDWARDGDDFIYVWDSMNAGAFHSLLPSWKGHADFGRLVNRMVDGDGEGMGRRAFAGENAALPERLRCAKVGEVKASFGGGEPILADVYAPPREGRTDT